MNTSMVASPSIPDLLKRIIDLVKRTASRNVILGLIAVSPGLLIMIAGWLATPSPAVDSSGLPEQTLPAIGWGISLLLAGFIVFLVGDLCGTIGAIRIADREDANEKLSVAQALRSAGRRIWSALTFSVLQVIVLVMYVAFVVFVTVLLGTPVMVFSKGAAGADVLNTVFVIIILSVVIVPVVYLLVAWSLGINAIAIDGSGPVDAFSRSAVLVKGAWWKIFLISALATLAHELPSFAVSELLTFSGAFGSIVPPALETSAAFEFSDIGQLLSPTIDDLISIGVSYMLAMLILPPCTTVLYLARRVQKDAELSPAEEAELPGSFNHEIV